MPSPRNRRRVLLACGGLFTAAFSGCLGDSTADEEPVGSDTADPSTTSRSPPSTADGPTPEPATVSDSDARYAVGPDEVERLSGDEVSPC